MYKNILVAIDLNDEASCHKPLHSAVELARTFGARLHVLTVVRNKVGAVFTSHRMMRRYAAEAYLSCSG